MPRQRPCCARRCARARARALLRMQLCSSVLLRSVVDLVPCRSHQLFAALLHGHARAEEATERSHRRSRRSPRSRLPPPPECHHHTGLQEDTEGASRVREGLVVNNHNFLDEIESTFSDRESTLGLASGGRLPKRRSGGFDFTKLKGAKGHLSGMESFFRLHKGYHPKLLCEMGYDPMSCYGLGCDPNKT